MNATNFYQPNLSSWDPRPFQAAPPANPITWVQGSQQVETYPVQYGGTVVLWDKEQPIIYIKSVDNFGNASVQILDYTFRKNQAPIVQEPTISTESEKEKCYVTKEDFDRFAAQLEQQLKEIVGNATKPVIAVNNTKPNRKFDKED